MAAFSWTYTLLHQDKTERSKKWNSVALVSTSGTYVSGGISLSASQLGLPYGNIEIVNIIDTNGDGYNYQWNRASGNIQMFQTQNTSAAGTAKLIELTSSVSPTCAITVEVIGY